MLANRYEQTSPQRARTTYRRLQRAMTPSHKCAWLLYFRRGEVEDIGREEGDETTRLPRDKEDLCFEPTGCPDGGRDCRRDEVTGSLETAGADCCKEAAGTCCSGEDVASISRCGAVEHWLPTNMVVVFPFCSGLN
jgi:hypothetical protein